MVDGLAVYVDVFGDGGVEVRALIDARTIVLPKDAKVACCKLPKSRSRQVLLTVYLVPNSRSLFSGLPPC